MTTRTAFDGTTLRTLQENERGPRRPVVYAHATVRTLDPLLGDLEDADLLVGDGTLVGVGPGLHTAAQDDDAIVVDCTGTTIVPAVLDLVAHAGLRARRDQVGTLTPGNPATFAVLPRAGSAGDPIEMVVWYPRSAAALVVDGVVTSWDGRVVPGAASDVDGAGLDPSAPRTVESPYLGTWIDETGFLHQMLTSDGRYDETRGGRPHAYQGAFWIDGDHVVYRDDLGFWAYGVFRDGVLHHAGYTLHRE